jgi:hypothetical protein
MVSLVRRRTIWWPTAWGWLLVVATLGGLAALALREAAPLLAVERPAAGARILIVEGWLDAAELDQAVARARAGRYDRVLTAGGPIDGWTDAPRWATFAERSADYLQRHGLHDVPVAAVPSARSQRERSYVGAVAVREEIAAAGRAGEPVDVFSAGVHARRSRSIYRLAFGPDTSVGILAARPEAYDLDRWWTTSVGAKAVLDETISLAWTACCFWPPAPPVASPKAASAAPG